MTSKPAFIDLFCGCGGFTLGMERAGFECVAAVDFNADAVDTQNRYEIDSRGFLVTNKIEEALCP